MLVTLVTNKEGRFPGFKAEFFQLPKMKGEQRSWPISPPPTSPCRGQLKREAQLWLRSVCQGCCQGRETWKQVTPWLLELALPTVLLAAVMMSPEEGKRRIMLD